MANLLSNQENLTADSTSIQINCGIRAYACCTRCPSTPAKENARLEVAIQATHVRTRQKYGPERLQAELREDGGPAGVGCIKRLRKKLSLRCAQVRRFTATTDSTHALSLAKKVLMQTFAATRPNETWVTDLTYVPTAEGWLYLAGIKDLFTCKVVGHAMGARMTTELVSQALGVAVCAKRPRPGLIYHSNRGSQYCAQAYPDEVRQCGMIASMSRTEVALRLLRRDDTSLFGHIALTCQHVDACL